MQRILVAVDFSPESEAAVRTALTFAHAFDAEITLLHVHELPTVMSGIVPGADTGTDTNQLRVTAQAQLDALRDRLQEQEARSSSTKLKLHTVVAGGSPPEMILQRAKLGTFDLIVMGTHGRTGLQRILVGSVAEAVIRAASCPVVTIHLPHPEKHAHPA